MFLIISGDGLVTSFLEASCSIFVWKSSYDCLPTKVSLRKRKMDIKPWCSLCRRKEEIVSHALFWCP